MSKFHLMLLTFILSSLRIFQLKFALTHPYDILNACAFFDFQKNISFVSPYSVNQFWSSKWLWYMTWNVQYCACKRYTSTGWFNMKKTKFKCVWCWRRSLPIMSRHSDVESGSSALNHFIQCNIVVIWTTQLLSKGDFFYFEW